MELNKFKLVDLTHTLSSEIASWDETCGFSLSILTDYKDCSAPDLFRTQEIRTRGGMGTHMDSPAHCFPGMKTIDLLELDELINDCIVINVSDVSNEEYLVMPSVIEKFEEKNGKISNGTFVIFYTGWDKYWFDPKKYVNNHKFPSIHETTAKMLLERNISGLGTDTLSADTGNEGFPVHRAILGAGKYLVENIANIQLLPITGSKILVLPMKVKDGTEAPIRLVALM